jgi:hypothetical protein
MDGEGPHARPETDALRQAGRFGDEELGRKRVLADPGFAIAELVCADHLEEVLVVGVRDAPRRPVVL